MKTNKLALIAVIIAILLSTLACNVTLNLGSAPVQAPAAPAAEATQQVSLPQPNGGPADATLAPTMTTELHKPTELQTVTVNSVEYGNDFSDRLTFTNGEILTGHTAPYEGAELDKIQHTVVHYTLDIPQNAAFAVAFGYSVKVEGKTYQPGAVIMLPTDQQKVDVEILDGELVLWRDLSAMHKDLSDRISTEIANGNLSIHGPLAFSFVSQEFASYIPQALLDARKVTIVK